MKIFCHEIISEPHEIQDIFLRVFEQIFYLFEYPHGPETKILNIRRMQRHQSMAWITIALFLTIK